MKKVFLTFALAIGILTVQAQSETKSESKQQTESTTDQKLDKDAKKPSSTQGTGTSDSATPATSGSTDDAETTDEKLPQPAATPKDSTDEKHDAVEKKDSGND